MLDLPASAMDVQDNVLPFQLENASVRGRLVRADNSVSRILRQHDYPPSVCTLLAEATAMAAALGTSLKFDGVFTLQTKTDGPVRMLVVDVTSDGAIRACAQFDRDRLASDNRADLLGHGHLVFTVDQKASDERYQGIVQLNGEGLTQAFQLYFKQSEQIPTGLMACAREDESGGWHAACLMVQRMPKEGGLQQEAATDTSIEDEWHRIMMLMNTCTPEELTSTTLSQEDLLYRLFHEDGVRVYDTSPLRQECRCSEDKIKRILAGISKTELKGMVQEDGKIGVTCEFCSKTYSFEPEDISV